MRTLKTLTDFNHAFMKQIPVHVTQAGDLIGMGIIVKHTKISVVLGDGMHYVKKACEFRIKP